MDGFISEDFLTLPIVLDSAKFQSVGLDTSYLGLSKDQSVPIIILENEDVATDCSLVLPMSSVPSSSISESEVQKKTERIHGKFEADESVQYVAETSSVDNPSQDENMDDLIEKIVSFKCKLCSFKSSNKCALSSHLRNFHHKIAEEAIHSSRAQEVKNEPPEKTAYLCGKCSEAFGTFPDWRSHLASVHKVVMSVKTILENVTLNGGAPLSLDKPRSPQEQRVILITNKDKKIPCGMRGCMVRLSSREIAERHKEFHSGARRFACPDCPSQLFRKWSDCASHLWASHSIDIDLFSCPSCDYKTAFKTKFENHIKIHSIVRKYLCTECGKTFKQAVQLKNHLVFHLKALGSPNIPNWSKNRECSQCERSFYDGKSLKKHIQAVHSNLRPYVCQVCGHTSARKNQLVLHLRQHTGEKPFSCPLCDFTTGDQNCLRRHAWRHSRVRPYSCPHCSYSCIQSQSLKNHLKSGHPTSAGLHLCRVQGCSFSSLSEEALRRHLATAHATNKEDKEKCVEDTFVRENECASSNGESGSTSKYPAVALDEESQNCFEAPVDTGGITIPAD